MMLVREELYMLNMYVHIFEQRCGKVPISWRLRRGGSGMRHCEDVIGQIGQSLDAWCVRICCQQSHLGREQRLD